jgi:hypothetical protein
MGPWVRILKSKTEKTHMPRINHKTYNLNHLKLLNHP